MSLIPPGTSLSSDTSLYTSVQVAVTCAALYDHALALGREVELIWMKPPSLVMALYVVDRYLGDVVLIASLCLCFQVTKSKQEYVNKFEIVTPDLHNILSQLDFRAWGALVYSWATQATMQLRIYAMYRRSRRILALLLTLFFCEIVAIAFIIWQTIGPSSKLKALSNVTSGQTSCVFTGINPKFIYIFIPFLCFESCLFFLVLWVFLENVKRNREASKDIGFRLNSFVSIMARDSLCYFFVNLAACAVVMGLWQNVTELYANICVPFVMFLEVLVGTRLILDFRERYARWGPRDPIVSGRWSALHFRGDGVQTDSMHAPVQCQVETTIVTDAGVVTV